jgi:dienelactone hydrolase
MRQAVVAAILLLATTACGSSAPMPPMPEQPSMMAVTPVNFMADDGLTVSGTYYRADNPKALILLFHQAGSSKDEYATIAPRLVEMGFAALAVDARAGGGMFGKNETAARTTTPATYGDALHDLDAALTWARTMNVPVIVWGSSYSSSLVFELAAKRPKDVSAVLSFSPGEYLGPRNPVAAAAAKVSVPVFVTSASDPAEVAAAKAIFDAVPAKAKTRYVPETGIHGSSTLIVTRNAAGAAANWDAVAAFLKGPVAKTL